LLRVFAIQKVAHRFSALLVEFLIAAALSGIRRISRGLRLATRRATIGKARFPGS